jgi:methyl-accepting chemotaxis protein
MATGSPEERIDRLEQVVQIIAEDQVSLQKLLAGLATETRHGFDQVASQINTLVGSVRSLAGSVTNLTEVVDKVALDGAERARALDERLDKVAHEGAERTRAMDVRVDRLVVAIGELIRRQESTSQ